MAFDLNSVVLLGRLTRDPEMRMSQSGKQICRFGIASNHGRDEASFFDCVAFERTAELIGQYCSKGKPLIIQGRLRQNRWQDQNSGENRSKIEIIVNEINFLPGSNQQGEGGGWDSPGGSSGPPPQQGQGSGGQQSSGGGYGPPDDFASGEDDIPF